MPRSMSSHSSSWIPMSSSIKLAPTEKFWASLVMTKASKPSPAPPGFSVCTTSEIISAPSAFILEWNSMQPTPSPKSISEAPEFFLTTPFDFLATSTDHTPSGTETGRQLPVARSQYLRPDGVFGSSAYHDFAPEASNFSTLAATGCPSFFIRATCFHACGVPQFEGAELPCKALAHGLIDLNHGIGNFGNTIGRRSPQIGERRPEERARLVGFLRRAAGAVHTEQHSNSRSRLFDVFRHFERREFRFLPRMVLQCFPVESQALIFFAILALKLLVEAALGFVAKHFALDHLAEERGNPQFTALVVHVFDHVRNYVPKNVEPHQINRPKRSRTRPAHGLARERVDLFYAQIHFLHQPHYVEHGKCADAVADEVRRIFRPHHALAQLHVAEVRDGFHQGWVGFRSGDEFQQPHIARRIKKVRAEPRALKVFRKSFGDLCHGKSASVGGDYRARFAYRLHLLEQRALDFEVLDNGLDNPIDIGQPFQVVIEISYGDV